MESGKKNQWPQLLAALDRLSRYANLILTLCNSGVDFVCRNMPNANTFTVRIFTVLAKAALAAKKVWGTQLSTPANFTEEALEQSLFVQ